MTDSPYLTRAEAAAYIRLKDPKTISRLPIARKKVGRAWIYQQRDLDAWMMTDKAAPGQLPAGALRRAQLSPAKAKKPSVSGGATTFEQLLYGKKAS